MLLLEQYSPMVRRAHDTLLVTVTLGALTVRIFPGAFGEALDDVGGGRRVRTRCRAVFDALDDALVNRRQAPRGIGVVEIHVGDFLATGQLAIARQVLTLARNTERSQIHAFETGYALVDRRDHRLG